MKESLIIVAFTLAAFAFSRHTKSTCAYEVRNSIEIEADSIGLNNGGGEIKPHAPRPPYIIKGGGTSLSSMTDIRPTE